MATESNSPGLHHSSFAMSRHAISFQSTASMSNISELVPMVGNSYYGVNSVNSAAVVFSADAGNYATTNQSTGLTQAGAGAGNCSVSMSGTSSGSGSGSPLLDSVPGLKHDTGFAVEWSVDEQYKLEEGLKKFSDEPSITRYIKIAAALHNKTVRDVALRCRWMTRKKRKLEEHIPGKKVNRKDKLPEFSKSMSTLPMTLTGGYSQLIQRSDQKHLVPFEGLGVKTKELLEQNTQAFSRITANIHSCKLQDNIDLLFQARNNISTILNNMSETPGIMSQMPPLPVSLDEDLAKTILPVPNHPPVFGSCSGMFLKQEPPRC